jgi:N-acetylglucosaminyl-diphospho-decaprenol L-rhamnosyltransferase
VNPSRAELRKALLIIITYNSYDSLPDVVSSIREFEGDHPGNHVVVVENSSDSSVCDFIESNVKSERILIEVASRNEGFSHGVNLGYKLARDLWGDFDFVVLLNPDVISAGGVVCELVSRAAKHSGTNVGVWGVVLRDLHGDIDRGCARRVWNRRRFFALLLGYLDFVRVLRTAPQRLTEYEIQNDQSELAMVSGGLMCISADILEDGLDTLLPMYLEDQEICLRSRARGFGVHLFPDLELVHVGGASRKSITNHERALRLMELVEAPVQCMVRLQGYGLLSLRLTVLLGGISRLVAAPLSAVLKILFRVANFRGEVIWMWEQQRLAVWFVLWAIKGGPHSAGVTLAEYFQEYAAVE